MHPTPPLTGPLAALHTQFPDADFTPLAIVLLLPLLGAFVNGVFGKRLGKKGVRAMALSALGGAFVMSVLTMLMLPHEGKLSFTAWHWFSTTGRMTQNVPIDVAFSVDGMSATMMLVITGVGFLIDLYSSSYMKEDPGYARFFAYLNLFCFAMLTLVMADNLALLFVGWEGVGLCSYLLIGFWFTEEKNATAGKKAFIVNRIGDFGLLLAIAMLVYYCGSLRWDSINANSAALMAPVKIWPFGNLSQDTLPSFVASLILPKQPIMVSAATLVGLAIFLGCAGKSAQIPLYVWLPDAMAGPTPVSALIHAATMVTAGVYLVARTASVFVLSPFAMAVVAVAGTATALFAASIGLFQNDLKKVLAYSTVSQLGFMFIGVGVGAFTAGFFHVFTHAFFKACLFLGAGSVIHAMHARIHDTDKSQDMRRMGGLRKYLPITRWTFLISCFAIAGAPPLAGFWSKDEILWRAFANEPGAGTAPNSWHWPHWLGPTIYWLGILAATMTAFYMFRAYFMTFHGEFRGWKIVKGWVDSGHEHDDHVHDAHGEVHDGPVEGPTPHESPWAMTVPLIVLAGFAIFAGFFNAEPLNADLHLFKGPTPLGHILEPVFEGASHRIHERDASKGLSLFMMLPGIGAFLAGTAGAVVVYWNRAGEPERAFRHGMPRLYRLIYDKWRIDEFYEATVVGMVDALADIFTMADKWIVDGILATVSSALVAALGTVLRAFQTGRVQAYTASMVVGLAGLAWFMIRPHAVATVDANRLAQSGEVSVSAAPGLGYTYRWRAKGVPDAKEFSAVREIKLKLDPGEKQDVVLEVKNAFESVATEVIPVSRPVRAQPGAMPLRPVGGMP